MSTPRQDIETTQLWHKTFAVETNHLVWSLLSKPMRSHEEDEQMIHAAHASRFHWSEVGTPVHLTRGDWLLSHVYVLLNQPQQAFNYASRTQLRILIWPTRMRRWRGRMPHLIRRANVNSISN